jgi:hypothetical protein
MGQTYSGSGGWVRRRRLTVLVVPEDGRPVVLVPVILVFSL